MWTDLVVSDIRERYSTKIARGEPIIIRDEKTASGRVHVGSLRGVALHGTVAESLQEEGIAHTYFFEINDFDPMDGLPVYLDKATFLPHMGKPLCDVPSPDGKAKNYAEYFAEEFMGVIKELGYKPEYTRSSELYKKGRYNNVIRLALEHASEIRAIYKRVSGALKAEGWLPISVICEKCGKVGTTQASDFDGETVAYSCGNFVEWAKGCGHAGRVSPFDGKAKLPWKVEWAAKFTVYGIDVEGGGKDHSTRGGAREIADAISSEVFKRKPPINIPYEFFVVGGKKMSSSKGAGSSAREIADLLPPRLLRFLLIQKDPQRVIDFVPDGDTIPVLYDTFDKYADIYFSGVNDDFSKAFRLAHFPPERDTLKQVFLPRYIQVVYLMQMPHVDIVAEIEKLAGRPLSEAEQGILNSRITYGKKWLSTFAPDEYKFEIQRSLPPATNSFTPTQKQALRMIAEFIASHTTLDGQKLHSFLHELKTSVPIEPKELFEAVYVSILGKKSGPKAGWFLSVLDKKFLVERFSQASSGS